MILLFGHYDWNFVYLVNVCDCGTLWEVHLPDIGFKDLYSIFFIERYMLNDELNGPMELGNISQHSQSVQRVHQCEAVVTEHIIDIYVGPVNIQFQFMN